MSFIEKIEKYKKAISLIQSMVLIVFGMFLGALYQEPINEFVDKNFYHREPYVTINVMHVFRVPNDYFINFTELSQSEGSLGKFRFHLTLKDNKEMAIVVDTKTNDATLMIDKKAISPWSIMGQSNELYENGTVKTYNCAIIFPYNMNFGPKETLFFQANTYSIPPNCTNCFEKTISVRNFGNKKLSNFKSTICTSGYIKGVDGYGAYDIRQTSERCIELRSENFLPKDTIEGRFFGTGGWDITEFYAWDEKNGEFPQEKLIETMVFIVPNCSL